MKWIVGIDEAGRGALAGPVAVGAVLVPKGFDWSLIPGVADSKQVSPKNREAIFRRAQELEKEGKLTTAVALVSEKIIDKKGITFAVRQGIERALADLFNTGLAPEPRTTYIKLDGLLHAPAEFKYQKTIIKGDVTEKEISLASIMAKVTRDRYMVRLAKKHPAYGFDVHKGYGTLAHRKNIKKHGLGVIHRTTFCKSCQ
jgi:ribonuclease HII